MKTLKSISLLFFVTLILGVGILGTAQSVSAQETPPDEDTERHHQEDDDDGDESPEKQKELAKQAKITRKQAKKIALRRVPGKIIEIEIEKEKGRLQWAIDIRATADGKVYDVEIDANTGEVLQAVLDDEDGDDDDGNSALRAVIRKAAGGIKNTTGKFVRLITGN